jgi:hypothetical protein
MIKSILLQNVKKLNIISVLNYNLFNINYKHFSKINYLGTDVSKIILNEKNNKKLEKISIKIPQIENKKKLEETNKNYKIQTKDIKKKYINNNIKISWKNNKVLIIIGSIIYLSIIVSITIPFFLFNPFICTLSFLFIVICL